MKKIELSDLKVGAKVLCIKDDHNRGGKWLGMMGHINEIHADEILFTMEGDIGGYWCSIRSFCGGHSTVWFILCDDISDEELFLFHVSGKLPERLYG